MILIDGTEIKTIGDGLTWGGAKDTVTRTLSFYLLYNPQQKKKSHMLKIVSIIDR